MTEEKFLTGRIEDILAEARGLAGDERNLVGIGYACGVLALWGALGGDLDGSPPPGLIEDAELAALRAEIVDLLAWLEAGGAAR